jgi:hypothetical protein
MVGLRPLVCYSIRRTNADGRHAARSCITAFGSYAVNPADKTLLFKMEPPRFPVGDTSEQKRSAVTAAPNSAPTAILARRKHVGEHLLLSDNPHRQRLIPLHEARVDARGFAHHLDVLEALQDLLPDDLQLQFGHAQP